MIYAFLIGCLVGLLSGWLIYAIVDRQFAQRPNDSIKPDMVYRVSLRPDPKATFWKYLLQSAHHFLTGRGGRCYTLTNFEGKKMRHGFNSEGVYQSKLSSSILPPGAGVKLLGICDETKLNGFIRRQGDRLNLLQLKCCWGWS